MLKAGILRRVLIPAATLVAESELTSKEKKGCVCKPSELPIYQPEIKSAVPAVECDDASPQAIENAFATARRGVTKLYTELDAYKRVSREYIDETRNNAEWLLKYLREEDNLTPKAGAIAIGGFTGFILGLRGGLIKRVFYASIGALGMASVCYPKEAAEYSEIGLTEGKKYLTIAYNFAYGVKKDDPPLQLPSLPKLPTSFSEVWQSVSKSASSLVSGEPQEEEEDKVKVIEKVSVADVDDEDDEGEEKINPLAIVSEAHEHASQSCHCPIGACLGQHDDGLNPSHESEPPSEPFGPVPNPDPGSADQKA